MTNLKIWKFMLAVQRIKDYIKAHFVQFILAVLFVVVLVVVTILVLVSQKQLSEFKTEDVKTYVYFGDIKFEYDTAVTLDESNGITKLKLDGEEVELGSQPLYYSGLKKAILPVQMSVVFPLSSGQQKVVPKFSEVDASEGGIYLKNNNLNYSLDTAFLYDGADLYFFINPVVIQFGSTEISLPAFSYVTYNFNKELYVYDFENDVMTYYSDVSDVVLAKADSYTVNLSIDSLERDNDKSRLLMKNFSYLSKLKS